MPTRIHSSVNPSLQLPFIFECSSFTYLSAGQDMEHIMMGLEPTAPPRSPVGFDMSGLHTANVTRIPRVKSENSVLGRVYRPRKYSIPEQPRFILNVLIFQTASYSGRLCLSHIRAHCQHSCTIRTVYCRQKPMRMKFVTLTYNMFFPVAPHSCNGRPFIRVFLIDESKKALT